MTDGYQATRIDRGDETALRQWYEVRAVAYAHDHPGMDTDPWEEFRERQLEVRDDTRREVWVLRDPGGVVVASARLAVFTRDNTDVVEVDLVVDPARRRAGVGTALLAAVRGRAGELGRTRLVAEIGGPLGVRLPGEDFAERNGGKQALAEIRRVLDLTEVDETRLDLLHTAAAERGAGYQVIQWLDAPDDSLLEDLAMLQGRMTTDAPLGDLDWEPERWDVPRMREHYERSLAVGRRMYSTAVRDPATGRLAGWTDIGLSSYLPRTAYQWNTIVLPEHRGRRLGTLLKVENLLLLRRESPATQVLHTWNAESNAHMVAVNAAMGFRPVEQWAEWVLPL